MRMFSAPELLHGKNKWYCPRCRGHVDAVKRIGIWKLPPLLIIHLKRFSYDKCVTGLGLPILHDSFLFSLHLTAVNGRWTSECYRQHS